MEKQRYTKKQISLISMSLLYLAAGINHFWHPHFYLKIMPDYIPFPGIMVYISGMCEMLFAALLCFDITRRIGATLIILMLIVFFTVHIDMVAKTYAAGGLPFCIAVIRLPLQFVLIRWAYVAGNTSFPAEKTV